MSADAHRIASSRDAVRSRYRAVRHQSEALCAPLGIEDHVIQPRAEVSPPKWHLGHTTWFFETFLLVPMGWRPDRHFAHLFNSYYNSVGERVPQPERGHYSRPSVAEIFDYRRRIDAAVIDFLSGADNAELAAALGTLELGLHHEQQHQELLVTDIKAILFQAPLYPAYANESEASPRPHQRTSFLELDGGRVEIGFGGDGFAFDNERPRHGVELAPFALAEDLVSNEQYLAFMEDGGYERPELWLSDGWDVAQREGWRAPLYWVKEDGQWSSFTLSGLLPVDPAAVLTHVSFYEAAAFANWARGRLLTEAEWEHAAVSTQADQYPGALLGSGTLQPLGVAPGSPAGPRHLIGEVWEWTQSAYAAYPGYQGAPGAFGEYNAKFMVNQCVLRGGSVATPASHIRPTYRNFFRPQQRWQFTGIRLARDP